MDIVALVLYLLGLMLMCAHLASRGTHRVVAYVVMGATWPLVIIGIIVYGLYHTLVGDK